MSTHALGTGTRNLSINIPADERDFLGRLGFEAVQQGEARSIGAWLRDVLAAGVKAKRGAKAAARIHEIRQRYYAGALSLVLLAGTAAQWITADNDDSARRVRTVRGLRVNRWNGRLELEEA